LAFWRQAAIGIFRRVAKSGPDLDRVEHLPLSGPTISSGLSLITPRCLCGPDSPRHASLAVSPFLAFRHASARRRRVRVSGTTPRVGGGLMTGAVSNDLHSLTSDLVARPRARSVIGPSRPPLKDTLGAPLYDWAYEPGEPLVPTRWTTRSPS
jgi:hypothetical protein